MNKAVRSFINKCAELGVDAEQLVKAAARGDQLLKLIAKSKRFPDTAAKGDTITSLMSRNIGLMPQNFASAAERLHLKRVWPGPAGLRPRLGIFDKGPVEDNAARLIKNLRYGVNQAVKSEKSELAYNNAMRPIQDRATNFLARLSPIPPK